MAKRNKNIKSNKHKFEFNSFGEDSDENFAYIAGYTSSGAPYGVTWEEWEDIEDKDNQSSSKIDSKDLPF